MATIFYGLAGEGRGHATRACTLIDALRDEHQLRVFAPGHAHDLLQPRYAQSPVRVERIPGPEFRYDRKQRIDKLRTLLAGGRYLMQLRGVVDQVVRHMEECRPDLCITDFDPVVPRAAERLGIPYVSVDHQHFMLVSDLSALPRRLRNWAWFMGQFVHAYYRRQARAVVSSFYFPPLRHRWQERAVQTGVLLRPELLAATPVHGDHICVYLRRFADERLLAALRHSGREVHIYGLGESNPDGNLRYLAVDSHRFVEDLATASCLVSTAGNQLLGEALYLGKPCFVFPEPGNKEQDINAHFLDESGAGTSCALADLDPARLRRFLAELETYRARIRPEEVNGNDRALGTVRELLGTTPPASAANLVTSGRDR